MHRVPEEEGCILVKNGKVTTGGTIATTVILAIVFVLVGIMFYFGEKDPVVNLSSDRMQMKTMYGLTVNYADVKDISLIEESMSDIEPNAHRDNGYGGWGNTVKGHFSSENLGKFMLFVNTKSSPTIRIERNDNTKIYMSFNDGGKTKAIYDELKMAISSK